MRYKIADDGKKMNFFAWLTVFFLIFYISGFKSVYVNYMVTGGAVALTAGYAILYRDRFSKNVWGSSLFKLLLIFLLLMFYYLYVYTYDVVKYTMGQYMFFAPMIICLFYEDQPKRFRRIFFILMLGWIFFAGRAYYMYSNDLVAARDMASHMVNENVMTGGGYGFAVGSAMLAVFLFEMLIWGNIKKHKFWIAAFIVLLAAVVKETYSTITILAMVFGLFTGLLFRMFGICTIKKINEKHFMLLVFIILLVVVFFIFKEDIGLYIIKRTNYQPGILEKRMREIGVLLSSPDNVATQAYDMNNRFKRLGASWNIFLENPIFGATYKLGGGHLAQYGLGSHGELADTMARYGIAGGIPFLMIFLTNIRKERKNQKKKIGFGYIVTFAILFYFNPFMYFQSTTVLFLIIPAITLLFNNINDEESVPQTGT